MTTWQDVLTADATRWVVQPDADRLLRSILDDALERCPSARRLATRILAEAGVRLLDILDHIVIPDSGMARMRLGHAGFTISEGTMPQAIHHGGIFPCVVLRPEMGVILAMKVESVADFLAAHQTDLPIEGQSLGTYRRARIHVEGGVELWVVERHGHTGFLLPSHTERELRASLGHLERLRCRQREFADPEAGFDYTDGLIQSAVFDLGPHWACDLFLRAEREYWERRNRSARIQKARQDALGIGWANDDHHTYDASREWFHRTIRILEALGFVCRERFYAGAEAGWGSQILEQPVLGTVIFADIDLAPDELTGDFAHAALAPLPRLRRAGLWCALHGESMLEAGLNHLECTYDSAALRGQLEALGVKLMAPFSDFPHLYQQLTVGEWWPVRPERVELLRGAGQISDEEADEFRRRGAIGSHLENLERNQGYKGFNQPGISDVLRIIDPREYAR